MEIKIEDYLSQEEIKEIVTNEVRKYIRDVIGNNSESEESKSNAFIKKLAKNLAKEGVQEIIPDFKELINEQIRSEIAKVKLSDFFVSSFGWSNPGNKVLNSVLSDNKSLLDAKIKEIFKIVDNEGNK
ncbi:MAG TPA: hypothetical protein P5513_07780 [Candidatus Diapherotrites archaeon]|nr:hypothetical protein [Candidatus Diapherotrites archaeon]